MKLVWLPLALLALAGCGSTSTTSAAVACHARGPLPDPVCTPGVASPAVTQATVGQTICVPGYTRTIRPPAAYTSRLKRAQILSYGYQDRNPADYEEDHYLPLELGGAPKDARNLWPEPGASPNAKDRVENRLHAEVCSGRLTLATAQREITSDWRTAQ